MLNQQKEQQHQQPREEEAISGEECMWAWEEEEGEGERNRRWSSGTTSSGTESCGTDSSSNSSRQPMETYFEMVNGPTQLVSGPGSKRGRFESTMVVVIEDSQSTVFELLYPEPLSPDSSLLLHHHHDQDPEAVDSLDAALLPDFFSYTPEERDRIRRNLPIRPPAFLPSLSNRNPSQPSSSPLNRHRRSNSKPYHLPTPSLLSHQTPPSHPPSPDVFS